MLSKFYLALFVWTGICYGLQEIAVSIELRWFLFSWREHLGFTAKSNVTNMQWWLVLWRLILPRLPLPLSFSHMVLVSSSHTPLSLYSSILLRSFCIYSLLFLDHHIPGVWITFLNIIEIKLKYNLLPCISIHCVLLFHCTWHCPELCWPYADHQPHVSLKF